MKLFKESADLFTRAIEKGGLTGDYLTMAYRGRSVAHGLGNMDKGFQDKFRYYQLSPDKESLAELRKSQEGRIAFITMQLGFSGKYGNMKIKKFDMDTVKKMIKNEDVWIIAMQGLETRLNQNYDDSIRLHTLAIEKAENNNRKELAPIYFDRSLAYELKGSIDKAIEDMKVFTKLHPFDTNGSKRLRQLQGKLK